MKSFFGLVNALELLRDARRMIVWNPDNPKD